MAGISEQKVADGVNQSDAKLINDMVQSSGVPLLSDPRWQQLLDDYKEKFTQVIGGLPRFGALSIIGDRTPMFVYDHPALEAICQTAFATETLIGFHKDFFATLVSSELSAEQKGKKVVGVEFLMMHELDHIMSGHHGRMRYLPDHISNAAQDVRINQRAQELFAFEGKEISPVLKTGWGFSDVEYQLFHRRSEESVGAILQQLEEMEPSQPQGQSGNSQEQGAGAAGSSQNSTPGDPSESSSDDPGDEANAEQAAQPSDTGTNEKPGATAAQSDAGSDGSTSGSDNANQKRTDSKSAIPPKIKPIIDKLNEEKSGDVHGLSDQDISKTLEDAGLDEVRDKLGLPESSNDESFGKRAEQQAIRNNEALAESQRLNELHSNGRPSAGGHGDSYAADAVKAGVAYKLSFQAQFKEAIHSELGDEFSYSDDFALDTAHALGVNGTETHVGDLIPMKRDKGAAAAFLDTSGSMPAKLKSDFLSTILQTLSPGEDEGFSKLYLGYADTATRGDLIEIDQDDVIDSDKFIANGGGGTDFHRPLIEVSKLIEEQEDEVSIDCIIYLTDMGASIPNQGELPDNLPPIIFVTTEQYAKLRQQEHSALESIGAMVTVDNEEYGVVEVDVEELTNNLGMS